MPRKASKTAKPPLLFLERPLNGATLQNVPDVRAALHPKEFFPESRAHSSSALSAWVSPQFDASLAAAPPTRRGRRKCLATTSILERCSQLSRKSSVSKFPSLSFQTRSRDPQPKNTRPKKATEPASGAGNQPHGSCQIKKAASNAQHTDTPKRQSASIRKKRVERLSDGAASTSRCVDQAEASSVQGEKWRFADAASTPASSDFSSTGPAPDVDTPKLIQEGSSCPSSPFVHLLQAHSPPSDEPPDILVVNTPEKDYGLKVTWRRRKGLMLLLKERGQLSDSDVSIHS